MIDPIDEYVVSGLQEYKGRKFKAASEQDVQLGDKKEQEKALEKGEKGKQETSAKEQEELQQKQVELKQMMKELSKSKEEKEEELKKNQENREKNREEEKGNQKSEEGGEKNKNEEKSNPQKKETITLQNAKQNLDAIQNDERRVLIKVNKAKDKNGKVGGKGNGDYSEKDKDW